MEAHKVKVSLVPLKTNLVNLPSELGSSLYSLNVPAQNVIIEIVFSQKRGPGIPKYIYTGWSGFSTMGNSIEIDPALANAYGLTDDVEVQVKSILEFDEVNKIHVEPVSSSDWEIVELHAKTLENHLLSQTRAVQLNGVLILYPAASITACLLVKSLEPVPSSSEIFAKISPNAEVIIAPRQRKKKKTRSESSRSSSRSRRSHDNLVSVLLRGISLPHSFFEDYNESNKFEVYANFDEVTYTLQKAEYVRVSIIPGPTSQPKRPPQEGEKDLNEASATTVIAKLVHDSRIHNHVGLSKLLAISLGISGNVGDMVQLQPTSGVHMEDKVNLLIHPFITVSPSLSKDDQLSLNNAKAKEEQMKRKKELQEMKEQFLEGFFDPETFDTPLTNKSKLPGMKGLPRGGVVEFKGTKVEWLLSLKDVSLKLSIGDEILIPESQIPPSIEKYVANEPEVIEKPIGQDKLLQKIQKLLRRRKIGALIYGASGSGKSLIVNEIAERLYQDGVYRLLIQCSDFSKESASNIKEKCSSWFTKCSWYTPSVLVLEGIESLFPAENENSDNGQTRQLTEFFVQNVNTIMNSKNLIILATARSKEAVNSYLFSSHCIEDSFNLCAPTKETRQLLIEHFLRNDGLSLTKKFDVSQLSMETEGYLPSDLKVLVDRINHESVYSSIEKGEPSPTKTVSNELFSKSIAGYVPSNLRGVKLQKSSTIWVDIGGLTEAKSILLETLEWPTKYAPIFKAATLRLRSGILLYGYPGCGKTLLASAVAGQCGLNFISVKGPEILNKYIGASEQSVRELFERAQAAKPCILFFDEFDSIAPKRGHDSTGVTDRVVNQMLTQMDGAEGLDGVYVLAATSRPDLIDSALLRPGRLDKSVICDMPHQKDRLDILKSITRKMNLGSDVDLNEVAGKTEGFSGADLQAVGYNAYLQAVHEKLEQDNIESEGESKSKNQKIHEFVQTSLKQVKQNHDMKLHERTKLLRQIEPLLENIQKEKSEEAQDDSKKKSKKDNGVVIKHSDFITSLKDTKPSISVSEKMKLRSIYSKFVSGRDGNMPDGTSSNEIGARSTLM